jgi:hypothetical protein
MAKPKAKVELVTCKVMVRTVEGIREACDLTYAKGKSCPEPGDHLNALKSGFCSNGWCEGVAAKTWRGNPAPTCKFWENCPCFCHDMISRMFAESGMERILVEKSAYQVDDGGFKHPTEAERALWAAEKAARSRATTPDAPTVIESPAPGIVPAIAARTFDPTATGRAARGELEQWVLEVTNVYAVDKEPEPCTPQAIAIEIGRRQGISPPSSGAVNAVLNRWLEYKFAIVERKPTRFIGYTSAGINKGLDLLKEEYKTAERQRKDKMMRGVRT